jgi:hypothetical protein
MNNVGVGYAVDFIFERIALAANEIFELVNGTVDISV